MMVWGTGETELGSGGRTWTEPSSPGECVQLVTWEPWCKEISLKDKEKEGKEFPVKKSCPAFMLDFIFNKGFHPMYSGSWVVVGEI